ncbi:hypothetical protein FRC02_004589 [Tulasnella sp. 418]|nr:hypothetical protein FRC02_004589 [Tulasnella sp. 418]
MIGDQNAITPINLHPCQRVTLDRRFGSVQDDGIPPVGLYLDAEEFDDFLSAHPSGMRFDKSFSDQVFNWTNGHVGAVGTLIQIVTADHSFRSLKGITEKYTWANLLAQISPNTLLDGLSAPGSVFGRGLPNRSELQDPDLARVLRHVLCNKEVRKSDFQEKVLQEKLAHCFRNGWLHTEEISSDIVDDFVYYFASPLHRWYVEAFLGKFSEADIKEDNLLDFVIQVIRHFSPIHFTTPRTIAGGCRQQQPPEAQFQDEFYRCCNIHTYGIPLLSELGASAGRIDFLLPRKRWGIELVRQSNKLEEHSGRFSTSGKYAGVVEMEDYIILNFCTIYPRVHRELRKLYHVFFTNEYQNVCILDNVLTKVPGGDFSLLMNAPAPLDY